MSAAKKFSVDRFTLHFIFNPKWIILKYKLFTFPMGIIPLIAKGCIIFLNNMNFIFKQNGFYHHTMFPFLICALYHDEYQRKYWKLSLHSGNPKSDILGYETILWRQNTTIPI
jgi:hypothetical protein